MMSLTVILIVMTILDLHFCDDFFEHAVKVKMILDLHSCDDIFEHTVKVMIILDLHS